MQKCVASGTLPQSVAIEFCLLLSVREEILSKASQSREVDVMILTASKRNI